MAKRITHQPPTEDRGATPASSLLDRHLWLWFVVIAVAAVAPYLPSLGGDLVWDDRLLIEEELRFYSDTFAIEVFAQDFFDDIEEIYRYGYYRPLTTLSYYLTWLVVKAEPLAYHVTNVAIHVLVSLLVLLLGRELAPKQPAFAIVGALLFAVHPMHVENVAWVSGRTDLLAGLLLTSAAFLLLKARKTAGNSRLLMASLICFAISPLAKEAVVFWPLVIAAMAVSATTGLRRWWWQAAVASTFVLIPAAVLRLLLAETTGPSQQWSAAELPAVVLTFFATVARYLRFLILPSGAEPYIQNPLVHSPVDLRLLVGAAAVAALVVATWRWRKSHFELSFAAAFLLLSLAPISNLIRIAGPADMGAPMAQRFLYIPSIGFCLLIAGAAAHALDRSRARKTRLVAWSTTVVVIIALAGSTISSAKPWRAESELFELMALQVSDAPLPLLLIGTVHCRAGSWGPCITRLSAAHELLPDVPTKMTIAVKSNLAGALTATARLPEARKLLLELREATTPTSSVEYNLGMTWVADGRTDEALACFDRALAINPWHPRALLARARIRIARRNLKGATGDIDAATGRYGDSAQSLVAQALVHGLSGNEASAADTLRQAAALDDPEGLQMLGGWAVSQSRYDESLRAYQRLAQLQPGSWQATHGAATALARLERVPEAMALLADYSRLHGAHPRIDALATSLRPGGD